MIPEKSEQLACSSNMKATTKLFLSLSLLALVIPISSCGKKESGPKSEKVKICMNVYKEH